MGIITQYRSPNYGDRVNGSKVDILLMHHTAMKSFMGAVNWLCNKESGVSAHYVVGKGGEVAQLVDEGKRAWHAGAGLWEQVGDVNSRSIGIEIDNNGFERFTEAQIKSVIELSADIIARNNIPAYNVIGHAEIAPTRKEDPNPYFEWSKLAEHSIGVYPNIKKTDNIIFKVGDRSESVAKVQKKLSEYGYGISQTGVYDEQSVAIITAFKRHFDQDAFTLTTTQDGAKTWNIGIKLDWTSYNDDMLNALSEIRHPNDATYVHTMEL